MKTIVQLLFLTGILSVSIFSQDFSRKKAADNALDTAYYLITSDEDPDTYFNQISELSAAYSNLNRQKEALKLPELLGEYFAGEKVKLYINLAEASLKKKDEKEAARLLSLALQNVNHNEFDIGFDNLNKLAYDLTLTGNDKLVDKLITSIDYNFFKSLLLVVAARAMQKKGLSDKSLKLLPEAVNFAQQPDFEAEAIARIVDQYTELGKSDAAIQFLNKIRNQAITNRALFNAVFDAYLKFDLAAKAEDLLEKQKILNESEQSLRSAELSWQNGSKVDTVKFLQQAAVFESNRFEDEQNYYPYDFSEEITALFLRIDEDAMALDFAKNIKKIIPRQDSLLKIADYYYQKRLPDSAELILNMAFEKVNQTDNSDFVFGNAVIRVDGELLSKENFLLTIADGFMILNKPDSALNVINSIDSSYQRAAGLIKISLKYKPFRQRLLQNLSKARLLIESDQEKLNSEGKINYWAILARMYDEVDEHHQSQKIFTDIINKINDDDSISEDEKLSLLITVGIQMGKLTNKNNKEVNESLKKFIDKWKGEED